MITGSIEEHSMPFTQGYLYTCVGKNTIQQVWGRIKRLVLECEAKSGYQLLNEDENI